MSLRIGCLVAEDRFGKVHKGQVSVKDIVRVRRTSGREI